MILRQRQRWLLRRDFRQGEDLEEIVRTMLMNLILPLAESLASSIAVAVSLVMLVARCNATIVLGGICWGLSFWGLRKTQENLSLRC